MQLKRRWDLVPALVETVKGYARHESNTLEHVVEARSQAVQSASIPERGTREQNLSAAVSRLFAVAEAYPDLKATQNFQDLQRNLVEIENNIQYARRYYNAVVRDWNTLVESIPSCWVAVLAGYTERPYFQLDDAERGPPGVVRCIASSRSPSPTRPHGLRTSQNEPGKTRRPRAKISPIPAAIPGVHLADRRIAANAWRGRFRSR